VQLILYMQSVCSAVSKPSHPLVSCHAAMARRYGIALPCRNLYPGFFISNIHANNRADGNVGYRGSIVQTEMETPGLVGVVCCLALLDRVGNRVSMAAEDDRT
jgi:hypothetical protein